MRHLLPHFFITFASQNPPIVVSCLQRTKNNEKKSTPTNTFIVVGNTVCPVSISTYRRQYKTSAHHRLWRLCLFAAVCIQPHVDHGNQAGMGPDEYHRLQHYAPLHPYWQKLLEPITGYRKERKTDGTYRFCLTLGTTCRVEDQQFNQCKE